MKKIIAAGAAVAGVAVALFLWMRRAAAKAPEGNLEGYSTRAQSWTKRR